MCSFVCAFGTLHLLLTQKQTSLGAKISSFKINRKLKYFISLSKLLVNANISVFLLQSSCYLFSKLKTKLQHTCGTSAANLFFKTRNPLSSMALYPDSLRQIHSQLRDNSFYCKRKVFHKGLKFEFNCD